MIFCWGLKSLKVNSFWLNQPLIWKPTVDPPGGGGFQEGIRIGVAQALVHLDFQWTVYITVRCWWNDLADHGILVGFDGKWCITPLFYVVVFWTSHDSWCFDGCLIWEAWLLDISHMSSTFAVSWEMRTKSGWRLTYPFEKHAAFIVGHWYTW